MDQRAMEESGDEYHRQTFELINQKKDRTKINRIRDTLQ